MVASVLFLVVMNLTRLIGALSSREKNARHEKRTPENFQRGDPRSKRSWEYARLGIPRISLDSVLSRAPFYNAFSLSLFFLSRVTTAYTRTGFDGRSWMIVRTALGPPWPDALRVRPGHGIYKLYM